MQHFLLLLSRYLCILYSEQLFCFFFSAFRVFRGLYLHFTYLIFFHFNISDSQPIQHAPVEPLSDIRSNFYHYIFLCEPQRFSLCSLRLIQTALFINSFWDFHSTPLVMPGDQNEMVQGDCRQIFSKLFCYQQAGILVLQFQDLIYLQLSIFEFIG